MLQKTSSCLLITVTCLGALVVPPRNAEAATAGASKPLVGTYFSSDYIQTLKATFSPRKANADADPQALELRGSKLLAARGFHEAYPTFSTYGRRFEQDKPWPPDGEYTAVLDGNRILFGRKNAPKKPFIFGGDESKFVAGIVLAGRYRDKDGNTYVFTDSTIELPSKQIMSYRIGLDMSEDDSDYFDTYVDETDGRRRNTGHYEFIRRSMTIVIYEREVHVPRSSDAAPLYDLKRL